ncbi:PA14 domain-containing protein, partial [Verrucomicrobiota bacterium]
TGVIEITAAGDYTFYTTSDDGSRLYIEDSMIVDNDGAHGMQERSGVVTLSVGKHPIRVDFFQGGGGHGLEVRYAGPGIAKQLIPNAVLYH